MRWTNDKPTIEGWYFWRRNGHVSDPLHWYAYYIETDMIEQATGQWAGPIPEPE